MTESIERHSLIPKKQRRGGNKPPMTVLLARAAKLMDQGVDAAGIALAMDVEIGTARGYMVRVRKQRGLTKPVKRTEGPIAVRLAAKVDTNGPVHPTLGTRCHLWTGYVRKDGYGGIHDTRGELGAKNEYFMAHRAAWMLATGVRLKAGAGSAGAIVRHRCDVPLCCNPEHLELGTQAENMEDKYVRGRAKRATDPEMIKSVERARKRRAAKKAAAAA
jgi:hypothetical protein